MQHSDKRKLYIGRILRTVIFVGIFVIANMIMNLLFQLPEGASEDMLARYSENCENYDTVIIGNSITNMVKIDMFDESTGFSSVNMGTPSQNFTVTLKALEMALEQNPVKRVVIMTGYDSFEESDDTLIDNIFSNARNANKPYWVRKYRQFSKVFERATSTDNINTTASITDWIGWIADHAYEPNMIETNYNNRIVKYFKGEKPGQSYKYDLDTIRFERNPLNYSDSDKVKFAEDMDILKSYDITEGMIAESSMQKLDYIIKYCSENSIELIYFVSPHESTYKARYFDNYEKIDLFLNGFMDRRGVKYYNFENNPDIHNILKDEYFEDWEHVWAEYTDISTNVISDRVITELGYDAR